MIDIHHNISRCFIHFKCHYLSMTYLSHSLQNYKRYASIFVWLLKLFRAKDNIIQSALKHEISLYNHDKTQVMVNI